MPEIAAPTAPLSKAARSWLIVLLAVAAVLRLILVANGGQFFFGDEGRHDRGVALYHAMRTGDVAGIGTALGRPEHIGFTLLGAVVTGLQHGTAQFTRWADWGKPENVFFTFHLGAAWLALFSVVNIWLVHRLARRAGAGTTEAGWAALLMACSTTGFYYARHFLPYDAAITLALAAVWFGLDGRRSFLCGLLAGATYHCYNGYWYLVPVILVLHLGWGEGGNRTRLTPLAAASCGTALALLLPVAVGIAVAGSKYWQTMIAFSDTVNQGLYREGWSLPWEFFWHAESWFGVLVLLAIAAALVASFRSGSTISRRHWLWFAAAAMSYGWLVLFSVGLEKFVVYARTVKPLVPFLCLAGGWAAAVLLEGRRRLAPVAVAMCVVTAGACFLPHFAMNFPADVETLVLRDLGNPKHSLSVAGSLYAPLALPIKRPDLVLVNAQLLYPVRNFRGYPEGKVLFSLPHPLSYRPFQYESHQPRERLLLRENEISIRLIRLANPAAVPDDLPVPERFTAADRATGRR